MEHFAQAGGDRSHLRPLDAAGQFDRGEPFVDELPRKVNIDAVLERHDDLREAELRNRSHSLQARQAADGLLDRKRDPLLNFFRPQRRRNGVDLHLHRRGIGKGIDIQVTQRHSARDGEDGSAQNHQQPVPQRKIDDPIEQDP